MKFKYLYYFLSVILTGKDVIRFEFFQLSEKLPKPAFEPRTFHSHCSTFELHGSTTGGHISLR